MEIEQVDIAFEGAQVRAASGSPTLTGLSFVSEDGYQVRFSPTSDTGAFTLTSSFQSIQTLWEAAVGVPVGGDLWQSHVKKNQVSGILPVAIGGSGTVQIRGPHRAVAFSGNVALRTLYAGESFWIGKLPWGARPSETPAVAYRAGVLYQGEQRLSILQAKFTHNTTSAVAIIGAVAGKTILPVQGWMASAGDVNWQFQEDIAGTPVNLTEMLPFNTKGIIFPFSPIGIVGVSEAVSWGIDLSAAIVVSGYFRYATID